jgi:hypothetical protein
MFAAKAQCDYTLEMNDSWGDGWNNLGPTSANTIDVLVNGVVVLDDVFVLDALIATETFTVNTGDDITVDFTGGGPDGPNYEDECSYRILDPNGVEVLARAYDVTIPNWGDIIPSTLTADCPSCLTPTAITSDILAGTNPTFSWTDSNSPAGTYEYYIVEQGDPTTFVGISTATASVSLTLDPLKIYDFYARTSCDGGTTFSEWSQPFEFSTGYCIPSAGDGSIPIFLDGVVTSGGPGTVTENIDNTGTGFTPGGYTDYTATDAIRGVYEGSSFDVTMSGATGFITGFRIWIDWNNDLEFDPVTEIVFDATVSITNVTATITVPAATPVGTYRMRIVNDPDPNNGGSNATPCLGSIAAEYEDYTIETVAPPSCLPPTDITSDILAGTNPTFSWTDPNSPVGTYEYYIVEQGEPTTFIGIPTATASVTLTLDPFTIYDFYARTSCDSGTTFSEWNQPFEYNTGICIPTNNDGTINAFFSRWCCNFRGAKCCNRKH